MDQIHMWLRSNSRLEQPSDGAPIGNVATLFVALCFVAVFSISGCSNSTAQRQTGTVEGEKNQREQTEQKKPETVGHTTLTIEYGDSDEEPDKEAKTFEDLNLTKSSTVEDIMQQASLDYKSKGSGQTAFLESIEGIENKGAGKRNWMYYVNDERADKSFGAFYLSDGDTIVWKFQTYENAKETNEDD